MLFGSKKDFDVLTHIGRELLKDIVEQEIGYYKLSLEDTQANLYGEATNKIFLDPNNILYFFFSIVFSAISTLFTSGIL